MRERKEKACASVFITSSGPYLAGMPLVSFVKLWDVRQ